MTQPLKCGIVGHGYMGEIRKRVIDARDDLVLVGVAEPSKENRAKIKGTEAFSNAEELLGCDLDVVFVATPNDVAPKYVIDSLRAGRHVFCEKPPGRSVQDIRDIRAVETGGLKLMFGFNHRYHPAVLRAKAIIDSGRLGRLINIRGLYGKSGGRNYRESWRNIREVAGGGILLDQGIHMLDLFRMYCGDFDAVKAYISADFWQCEVEDNAFVVLRGVNGTHATLHSSATLWRHAFRIDITMELGYLIVEGLLSKSGSYGRERLIVGKRQFEDETDAVGNPSEEVTQFDRDTSWEMEIDMFLDCIKQDRPVDVSNSLDALKVMEIIDRAYQDAANEGSVL